MDQSHSNHVGDIGMMKRGWLEDPGFQLFLREGSGSSDQLSGMALWRPDDTGAAMWIQLQKWSVIPVWKHPLS